MDEEVKMSEKKKAGVIRRVLGWIWVGLLSALLIAGIVFSAPWKVVGLVVVFLLAAVALPRRFRKWFWAGVGAVVIVLIVWVFLPETEEGWRPYVFEEEVAELEAKYAVADAENAALIYTELLEQWQRDDPNEPNIHDEQYAMPVREKWLRAERPAMAAWLDYHRGTIEGLIIASKMEKCAFPIRVDPAGFSQTMDRLAPMRQLVYLLVTAANNDLAEGGANEAVEKWMAILRMSRHLNQQHTLVEMLVANAIEALAIREFKEFIVEEDAADSYLAEIETAISGIEGDWSIDFLRALEGEKLFAKTTLGSIYEVNERGKVRLSRNPSRAIAQATNVEWGPEGKQRYWERKLCKVSTIFGWFFWPSHPQEIGAMIDESYAKYEALAEPGFDWSNEPAEVPITALFEFKANCRKTIEVMADQSAGVYCKIHDLYLRFMTDRRGCLVLVGLRRYKTEEGRWPKTLKQIENLVDSEVLVDAFAESPFVYKPTDEDFRLYSKGKNGVDEDGQYEVKYSEDYRTRETVTDDWMIWPRAHKKCGSEKEGVEGEQQDASE